MRHLDASEDPAEAGVVSHPIVCEDCGGPAVWTFIRGVVYYHCESLCEGFLQLELFPGDRVDVVREGDSADEVDRSDHDLPF